MRAGAVASRPGVAAGSGSSYDPRVDDGGAGDNTMTCGTCGRQATGEGLAEARVRWTFGTEPGRTVWVCDRCSRLHARSIEGKLDSEWW